MIPEGGGSSTANESTVPDTTPSGLAKQLLRDLSDIGSYFVGGGANNDPSIAAEMQMTHQKALEILELSEEEGRSTESIKRRYEQLVGTWSQRREKSTQLTGLHEELEARLQMIAMAHRFLLERADDSTIMMGEQASPSLPPHVEETQTDGVLVDYKEGPDSPLQEQRSGWKALQALKEVLSDPHLTPSRDIGLSEAEQADRELLEGRLEELLQVEKMFQERVELMKGVLSRLIAEKGENK